MSLQLLWELRALFSEGVYKPFQPHSWRRGGGGIQGTYLGGMNQISQSELNAKTECIIHPAGKPQHASNSLLIDN